MNCPAIDEGVEDQDVEVRQEANLEIDFVKAATDLPDIWGTGEDVHATITLTDLGGQAIVGATVTVSHGAADEPSKLVTGEPGRCDVSWTFSAPGEYWVSADFEGDDIHLPDSSTHTFRIVDFREEIVSLYNVFSGVGRCKRRRHNGAVHAQGGGADAGFGGCSGGPEVT